MKKKFSRKALKKMEQAARREEWIDLVRLERLAEFAAWLAGVQRWPDYHRQIRRQAYAMHAGGDGALVYVRVLHHGLGGAG